MNPDNPDKSDQIAGPPAFLPAHHIFLTGYMGAGKSTIGKALAEKLGVNFIDTDRALVKRFQMSISRIFQAHGEEGFRQAEVQLLSELSRVEKPMVISAGGGTLTREETFEIAAASGRLVYLRAPVEELFERVIFSHKDRPMINVPNAEEVFRERFEQREPFYNRSQIIIDSYGKHRDEVVAEIIAQLDWPEAPTLKTAVQTPAETADFEDA